MGSEDPSLLLLSAEDTHRFEALYAIYGEALPRREQKGRGELLAMLRKPEYLFLSAETSDRMLGFAIVFNAHSSRISLLEYMAVAKLERRRGIGELLFRESRKQAAHAALLLEVDAPEPTAEDNAMRVQRMRFYRRLGCRRVGRFDYVLPLRGSGPPPAMHLYAHCGVERLPKFELKGWLAAIYAEVYACSTADERIELMLSEEAALVTIE